MCCDQYTHHTSAFIRNIRAITSARALKQTCVWYVCDQICILVFLSCVLTVVSTFFYFLLFFSFKEYLCTHGGLRGITFFLFCGCKILSQRIVNTVNARNFATSRKKKKQKYNIISLSYISLIDKWYLRKAIKKMCI